MTHRFQIFAAERSTVDKAMAVRRLVQEAHGSFFSIGIQRLEARLNAERAKLLNSWAQTPRKAMTEYGLPEMTHEQGMSEIMPVFELFEPNSIDVHIRPGEGDRRAAMDTRPRCLLDSRWPENVEDLKDLILNIYLDRLSFDSDHIGVLNSENKETAENVPMSCYHELLHCCGDATSRGRHDGILRHNVIGIRTVLELLSISNP